VANIESRLADLGLTLPAPKPAVANYLTTKRSGDLLFVSGRVSRLQGVVGADVIFEQGREAARDTVLDLLATIRDDLGTLESIASVERLHGFVRSAPAFTQQPAVLDGASDLLVALFGEAGRHARTATGTNQLPFGAAIQLDLIVRLDA